jgi:hypothetical protein
VQESVTTFRQVGEQTSSGLDVDINTDLGGRTYLIFNYGLSSPRYDDAEELSGLRPIFVPRNLLNLVVTRSRMEGFIVIDYVPRFAEGAAKLAQWVAEGKLAHAEDIQRGIENAPKTFLRLFQGKNLGKQLLQLAEPAP